MSTSIEQWQQKDAAWLNVAQALQRVWEKKSAAAEQAIASAQTATAAEPEQGDLKLSTAPQGAALTPGSRRAAPHSVRRDQPERYRQAAAY